MSNSVGESYPHALPELDVTPIPEHRQLASFDNYHLPRKNASFDIIIWHWHLWGGRFQMAVMGERQVTGESGRESSD
jgi:hypothetical protein